MTCIHFFSLSSAFPCPSSVLHGVFALSLDVGDASCDRSKLCPAALLPLLLSNLARGGPVPPENHGRNVPESNLVPPSIAWK